VKDIVCSNGTFKVTYGAVAACCGTVSSGSG
jgi:hypothetical protein